MTKAGESCLGFLLPKQEEKSIDLQHDSNDGPANKDYKNSSQEEAGGLQLVLLKEEAECPLQSDDESQSSDKQYLQETEWSAQSLPCFVVFP